MITSHAYHNLAKRATKGSEKCTPFKQTTFLLSAAKTSQFPEDNGNEIAFVGYSNAGKSSAINAITNTKNLARISKTPGRTQLINFFRLDDIPEEFHLEALRALDAPQNVLAANIDSETNSQQRCKIKTEGHNNRLVDLPGYGYAKVAKNISCRWPQLINGYLENRESLRGIILIMDIRHPLKKLDINLIQWAVKSDIPLHILLTKTDKLTRNEAAKTLHLIENHLTVFNPLFTVQTFSSSNNIGLDDARNKIISLLYSKD